MAIGNVDDKKLEEIIKELIELKEKTQLTSNLMKSIYNFPEIVEHGTELSFIIEPLESWIKGIKQELEDI
jgi:hypothetical protein